MLRIPPVLDFTSVASRNLPMGISLLQLVSGCGCRAAVTLLFHVLLWNEAEMGGGVASSSPPINLTSSPDRGSQVGVLPRLGHQGGGADEEHQFVAAFLPTCIAGKTRDYEILLLEHICGGLHRPKVGPTIDFHG
jgi:hypothetical protein